MPAQTIAPRLRGCLPVAGENILFVDFILIMVFETSEYLYLVAGGITSHIPGLVVLGLTLVRMIHACMQFCMHKRTGDADIGLPHRSPLEDVLPESPYGVALPRRSVQHSHSHYSQWTLLMLIFDRNTLLHLSVRYDVVITMHTRRLTQATSDIACQRGCTVNGKEPAASSASSYILIDLSVARICQSTLLVRPHCPCFIVSPV